MTLARLIYEIAHAYTLLIVIYCVFSWIPISRDGVLSDIRSFLTKICEPYLNLFRRLIPPIGGAIDITPIIAIVVLQLATGFLVRLL